MFIYKNDDNIIATCGLQIIDYLPQCNDNGKLGYICNVYTLKEYRNRGIQSELLRDCINYSKENDITELQLSSDNLEVISIYKKQGFIQDYLIMKLEIK